MKKQAKLIEKGIIKEAFVIFDDCLDDPGEFKSAALKKLSTQCRHYHITLIMSTQYPNCLPSRLRANCMSVFIFYSDNKNTLESLYNSYGQVFETYNDFKSFVLSKTGDYKFIYFNKMKTSEGGINDYKVMRCPPTIPRFHIKFNTKL
jgi:hypothetical protein